ncbi:uncharacterized protein LOC119099517, partial [Pollicipes pollicipes]|uniref:uncharacterized protein LOC119099517 n=1 Tax=Pollicipes pollicipes TaxID=41117 RepID=UPI0018852DF1
MLPAPLALLALICAAFGQAGAQGCFDAAGTSFFGENTAYFLDQRYNCTIMTCRDGRPKVLLKLCEPPRNCQPAVEHVDLLEKQPTFCTLSPGLPGIVVAESTPDAPFYPQVRYKNLPLTVLTAILRSPLPEAAKQILLSRPPETADDQSETLTGLMFALESLNRDTKDSIWETANGVADEQRNSTAALLAAGMLAEDSSSSGVFNLNFQTSAE